MRNRSPTRKQRFQAALRLRGMTQDAWAREYEITASHLSLVLNEKRDSETLLRKVDAWTADVLDARPTASAA